MSFVLVIDAVEGVTEQDAKIAGIAHERGKGIVIAVNKWDAIEKNDKTIYRYTQEDARGTLPLCRMRRSFSFPHRPDSVLPKLFETIDMVIENQCAACGNRRAERDHGGSCCHCSSRRRIRESACGCTILRRYR